MSKFGDLLRGGGAPAPKPEPVVEEVLITPEEEVLTEASPLEEMNKKNLKSTVEPWVLNSIDAVAKRL